MKLLVIILLSVPYASTQFYPGYPFYNGPYYGLQHFFAPISYKITPPLNSPSSAPSKVQDTHKTGDTESIIETVAKTPSCDCNYDIGNLGCKIVRAAPPGYSCYCKLNFFSCAGIAITCINKNDAPCKNPGTSVDSCVYGGGNCNGYSAPSGCSCKYSRKCWYCSGGCYIAKAAPAFFKCHCDYVSSWTCSGSTIANSRNCRSWPFDDKCLKPGTSKDDCTSAFDDQSGKPDCDGY